ncbi:hypothetical protein, partial [Desulfosporosinus sp. OT]|uniref:hypothetical protein n=1 Tax=Desulfosporosinus sp. OT TaxID=913865 RepID=UPI001A9963AB
MTHVFKRLRPIHGPAVHNSHVHYERHDSVVGTIAEPPTPKDASWRRRGFHHTTVHNAYSSSVTKTGRAYRHTTSRNKFSCSVDPERVG